MTGLFELFLFFVAKHALQVVWDYSVFGEGSQEELSAPFHLHGFLYGLLYGLSGPSFLLQSLEEPVYSVCVVLTRLMLFAYAG